MSQADTQPSARDDIKRGFVWLGAASVIARVLDAGSVLVVMWFVTREQIGLATLAWSVAVFLEAMNGLGLNTALLQSKENTREQLSAAFWYTMGLATLLIALTAAASPWLASWFGHRELIPMLIVASTKLWFVGAALVPLNQLNRNTRFERIAAVSTMATLGAGLLTCSLAALGFQAWALLIGQASHGLFTLIGAQLAYPFRPCERPRFAPIRHEAAFGARVAGASVLYHFYRNADYYLLGRFLGVGAVGVYRIAFDLAMTPTLSVLTVVNRSALPVYARLNERPRELADAFLWTLRSLGVLLTPVTALLLYVSNDLLAWVNGGRWREAAPMVQWLAIAALLRCCAETFPTLFNALRRPSLALYNSLFTMVLLLALLGGGLHFWGGQHGPVVAAWAWTALYPCTLLALVAVAMQLLPLSLVELAGAFKHSAGAFVTMGAAQLLFQASVARLVPRWLGVPADIAWLLLVYAAYVRIAMGVTLRGLSKRNAETAPTPR